MQLLLPYQRVLNGIVTTGILLSFKQNFTVINMSALFLYHAYSQLSRQRNRKANLGVVGRSDLTDDSGTRLFSSGCALEQAVS